MGGRIVAEEQGTFLLSATQVIAVLGVNAAAAMKWAEQIRRAGKKLREDSLGWCLLFCTKLQEFIRPYKVVLTSRLIADSRLLCFASLFIPYQMTPAKPARNDKNFGRRLFLRSEHLPFLYVLVPTSWDYFTDISYSHWSLRLWAAYFVTVHAGRPQTSS